MTTSRETSVLDVLREWSAGQLGVNAAATHTDVRGAFLRGLVDEDFVPPETWKPALHFLLGRGNDESRSALEQTFLQQSEDALAAEVEAFGLEFSLLDPVERRRQYYELERKVLRIPRLVVRLRRLEKGLEVPCNCEADLDGDVKELAAHVWVLFVLPPFEAARRRQEYLAAAQAEMPRWEDAARQLCKTQPKIAALDSGLVQDLLSWRDAKRRRAKARARAAAAVPAAPRSTSSRSSLPRIPWILIPIAIGVIRLVIGLGPSSNSHVPQVEPRKSIQLRDDGRFIEQLIEQGKRKREAQKKREKGVGPPRNEQAPAQPERRQEGMPEP